MADSCSAPKDEVTLTKEQAEILLPLLPKIQKQLNDSGDSSSTERFSIEEMFEKKKKNSKASAAQIYLLVRQLVL